jgi:ribosome-associated heat shock protein Hsp15
MDRQRIDKWLWHARVVRTRTVAAGLVTAGQVRINGQRNNAASQVVRVGDVLTVALDRTVRILKVIGFAERRGSVDSVQGLYDDLSPPPVAPELRLPSVALREPGEGRPTKRDRRAIERFKTRNGYLE